jgi:hypothetical protein
VPLEKQQAKTRVKSPSKKKHTESPSKRDVVISSNEEIPALSPPASSVGDEDEEEDDGTSARGLTIKANIIHAAQTKRSLREDSRNKASATEAKDGHSQKDDM